MLLSKTFISCIILSVLISKSHELDAKETKAVCVASCELWELEQWKQCANQCFGDSKSKSEKAFLECETDIMDKLIQLSANPNDTKVELGDLPERAQKCFDDYLNEAEKKL